MKDKFSEARLTECSGDKGNGWQGHLRVRKHCEERQRNTHQHGMSGSANSSARLQQRGDRVGRARKGVEREGTKRQGKE